MGILSNIRTISEGIIDIGESVGKGAIGVGLETARSLNSSNGARNILGTITNATGRAARHMGYWKQGKSVYDAAKNAVKYEDGGLRLTKTGWGILGGGALVAAVPENYNSYMDNRVGAIDAQKRTATPMINPTGTDETRPLMPEDTGATGDLVFALNELR